MTNANQSKPLPQLIAAVAILVSLFTFSITKATAQNWLTAGNSGSSTLKLGLTDTNDLNLYTSNLIRSTITKNGDWGVGLLAPNARQEILYCPVSANKDIGLIVTHQECPGTNGSPFSPTQPDNVGGFGLPLVTGGGEGGLPSYTLPISFLTGNLTNFLNPLNTTSKPIFWVRTEKSANTSGNPGAVDEYDTKFIVMPDGSTGINLSHPRAALDVRGSQVVDHPTAIFGSRAIGTGITNSTTNLFQYYTQQLHIVPNLSENGYNQISTAGDQGLFFSDGKGADGSNSTGALVIAPWSTDSLLSGLRIDASGNIGIGTNSTFGYKMAINGKLICKQEVKVTNTAVQWPDFVFVNYSNGEALEPLPEVKKRLMEDHHLKGVPSAEEIEADGVDLVQLNAIMLQKIEELTLYVIELEEKVTALQNESN